MEGRGKLDSFDHVGKVRQPFLQFILNLDEGLVEFSAPETGTYRDPKSVNILDLSAFALF